jgi:GGDEF domain-containing protein
VADSVGQQNRLPPRGIRHLGAIGSTDRFTEVLQAADTALHEAKATGRDRVVASSGA